MAPGSGSTCLTAWGRETWLRRGRKGGRAAMPVNWGRMGQYQGLALSSFILSVYPLISLSSHPPGPALGKWPYYVNHSHLSIKFPHQVTSPSEPSDYGIKSPVYSETGFEVPGWGSRWGWAQRGHQPTLSTQSPTLLPGCLPGQCGCTSACSGYRGTRPEGGA